MTNDVECLENITKHLNRAIVNLYEVQKWIEKRDSDYYHHCDGFMRMVHQCENLYTEYNYKYLKKKEGVNG